MKQQVTQERTLKLDAFHQVDELLSQVGVMSWGVMSWGVMSWGVMSWGVMLWGMKVHARALVALFPGYGCINEVALYFECIMHEWSIFHPLPFLLHTHTHTHTHTRVRARTPPPHSTLTGAQFRTTTACLPTSLPPRPPSFPHLLLLPPTHLLQQTLPYPTTQTSETKIREYRIYTTHIHTYTSHVHMPTLTRAHMHMYSIWYTSCAYILQQHPLFKPSLLDQLFLWICIRAQPVDPLGAVLISLSKYPTN